MANLHIAQIGTGRVGRPTAYTIMCSKLADKLTVCDVKPRLSAAFAEELKHVTASTGIDVEINSCEKAQEVTNADIILISAGQPRAPGIKMTRRDLSIQNAKIIKEISQATISQNPQAKYIVITNPVDAMAMVCKKYTKASFVISTGTNLESLRFRSKLAETLKVPISNLSGWIGGEHGDAAVPLWSTVKVNNEDLDTYIKSRKISLQKEEVSSYVKTVSKAIVDNIGGTELGPAASFRDIVRAIVNNTGDIIPIATPQRVNDIPEPVLVSVPIHVGKCLGDCLYDSLLKTEQDAIGTAAQAIYQTYLTAIENIENPV